jgi:multiple sugar transport system ATP-binding protein
MAEVRLEKLMKTYRSDRGQEVTIVKGIDLTIREHEFLVLVGPSGCGKSTTLRMIAGLEEINGGAIYIGDRRVNEVAPKDRDIAMVFQNYALYPHMTVYRNMAFGLELRKFPKPEIERRVHQAATILGLSDEMLTRKPRALSGGQRQRVALGRAIVRDPKVFLFDEPLSNLDAKMRVQMRTEIVRLHARIKCTMIYVTHDQVEAMTMGDRIAVMKDGVIQQVADPLTLYTRPSNVFVAGFIGSPPMNLLRGHLRVLADGTYFIEDGTPAPNSLTVELPPAIAGRVTNYRDKPVIFGIRPEDIEESGTNGFSGPTIRARVDVSEPMGAETLLYVRTAGHTVIARAKGHRPHTPEEEIELVMNLSNAHIFDSETEESLAAGGDL